MCTYLWGTHPTVLQHLGRMFECSNILCCCVRLTTAVGCTRSWFSIDWDLLEHIVSMKTLAVVHTLFISFFCFVFVCSADVHCACCRRQFCMQHMCSPTKAGFQMEVLWFWSSRFHLSMRADSVCYLPVGYTSTSQAFTTTPRTTQIFSRI